MFETKVQYVFIEVGNRVNCGTHLVGRMFAEEVSHLQVKFVVEVSDLLRTTVTDGHKTH
jgi:hypothetical protein